MKRVFRFASESVLYIFLMSWYLTVLGWFNVGITIINFIPDNQAISDHNVLNGVYFFIGFVIFSCAFNVILEFIVTCIKKIFNK